VPASYRWTDRIPGVAPTKLGQAGAGPGCRDPPAAGGLGHQRAEAGTPDGRSGRAASLFVADKEGARLGAGLGIRRHVAELGRTPRVQLEAKACRAGSRQRDRLRGLASSERTAFHWPSHRSSGAPDPGECNSEAEPAWAKLRGAWTGAAGLHCALRWQPERRQRGRESRTSGLMRGCFARLGRLSSTTRTR